MRLAVVNCNTSERMTAEIAAGARAVAGPGTEIVAVQPRWGAASAEGFYDSYVTAAAVLDRLAELDGTVDGVVMAGFGEHGREGARELLDVPVVDITEAAAMHAMLVGHRYGVVTTLARVRGLVRDSLRTAGLHDRCVAVEATDVAVLDVGDDLARTVDAFVAAGNRALAAGADAIVLGCAGFTSLHAALRDALPVPVVDPVAAGVVLAEGLVRSGASTSSQGPYSRPLVKARTARPVG
ncbi:aspartate/glutamate racemase family protein [Isoptericola sp. NPDC019693]|uniref:aspartate/glutamate racemase family protein n=1 Tax=Isoptericola sp. NPDC019693 TaxID=3364009 RepID=UPI0037927DDD